tara:strand:+ start:152 stop:328 length:177 start_codon:yes stop_codon:yes gene_type:complete
MMQKMRKRAIRSKSKFLASNVAVAVLLGLMNVQAVMVLDIIQFAEHGTIHFRVKTIEQ